MGAYATHRRLLLLPFCCFWPNLDDKFCGAIRRRVCALARLSVFVCVIIFRCHCWPSPTQKGQQQIQAALGKGGDGGKEGGAQMSNGPGLVGICQISPPLTPPSQPPALLSSAAPQLQLQHVGGHLLLQQCCADDVVVVVLVMMRWVASEVKRNFCKFTRNPKENAPVQQKQQQQQQVFSSSQNDGWTEF
ncbi:hypothetical protein niasHT_007022 [Heterodera trifolii]|uniref:Uncharacterized protein n=1 Tax=Heterodera trifolii TaxID=157864 RepID=A0ABD2LXF9_9BILA